jgi:glycosyltransferase involved in cell wall biosynthesis
MQVKIVHIVANINPVNFGVWNAAIFASDYLLQKYSLESFLWVCSPPASHSIASSISVEFLGHHQSFAKTNLRERLKEFLPGHTVFVSHGCWLSPTWLGYELTKLGFYWVYTPHGMLEPWSINSKGWKKKLYFLAVERWRAKAADAIRAVSSVERNNLSILLKKPVTLIENGVDIVLYKKKEISEIVFLFLGRLHGKKGVALLAKAWDESMKNSTNAKLIIAGPDEGELEKIAPLINGNMSYVGPVYGEKKNRLLQQAHYFVLPSFSEGFPTSVVEAMSYGVIPVISQGCNFNAVFDSNLGYKIETTVMSIANQLKYLADRKVDDELSGRVADYVRANNSSSALGDKLFRFYSAITRDLKHEKE